MLALAGLLPAASTTHASKALADDSSMDWTGVLDEASFSALHELTGEKAPAPLGKTVDVGDMKAYLSLPKVGEPVGAVVVIHEWWGLNDHVKHWTDRLASDGYAALAVDLYDGTVATTREEALAAMRQAGSDEKKALERLAAAHAFLSDPEGDIAAERTASIGWCFGGAWSLKLAMAEPELDGAVIYYGRLVDDPQALKTIQAPVLGVFGNNDRGIPPEAVAKFKAAMDTAGKDIQLRQYDANHAFANPSSARYDAEHAAAAWRETRAFLCEKLSYPAAGEPFTSGRELKMFTPDGWKPAEVGKFSAAAFDVGNAKCTVTFLRGNGGGLKPNLDRWRQQMGEKPFTEDEVKALPTLPILGRLGSTMRARGAYTPMGGKKVDDALLIGTIAELDGESIFVKLIGPADEVEAATSAYAAFCRSLR